MKTYKNQSGSAHVVIIIILIIAILGLLGFVFWQNFVQKKTMTPAQSATTTSKTSAVAPQAAATAPQTTATSLVVGNYGVEVPYDSSSDTYTVATATSGGFAGGYTVYSKKVTEACGSNVNVGTIKRFNQGDSVPTPSNSVTIGTYQYALSVGAYGNCSTDSGMKVLDDASAAFGQAFNNLKIAQ